MSQTQIFQLIAIILAMPLLAVIALPATKFFIDKLPRAQQAGATHIVEKAVQAVEQIASASTASMSSADKKALAVTFVGTMLKDAGISLPVEIIATLIESAVFAINQSKPVVISMPATGDSIRSATPASATTTPLVS